jgi:4-diphosphocytidyl-2-C-methyl-D-erythritol kinase
LNPSSASTTSSACVELPSFRAYAKINLGLFVIDKRRDGFHNIKTVFHRVNPFDEISFDASPQIGVVSASSVVPSDERNICYQAASLLAKHLNVTKGVMISIQKNIPVGAGLGGGSSDAATVLLHLPGFWARTVSNTQLQSLALQLGSDVPYFLNQGSALAKGRGEVLEYFTLDVPFTILLCNPGIHISTAWAYQHVTPRQQDIDLKNLMVRGMRDTPLLAALANDFEEPVFQEYPMIREVKESMLQAGAIFSSMSGSGSTVYGLFSDAQKADKAAGILDSRGWKTYLTDPHFSPLEPEPL